MSGANVSVIGIQEGMGGLTESIAKFRKHHAEVGDALMNVSGQGTATGEPVHKDEPRMPYVHQDWPMMVYHAQHGELIVSNKKELAEAERQGYREEPYPKAQIEVLDPATEKKALKEELDQLKAQLARLLDQKQKTESK